MLDSARTEKEGMGWRFQKLISVMWPVSKHEKPHGTKEAFGLQWTSVWKVPLSSALWRLADSEPWWNTCSPTSPRLYRSEKRFGDSWSGYIVIYCVVLTVTTYILRTLNTLQIRRSAVAMGVSSHQRVTCAPKETKEGTPKSQVRDRAPHEQDSLPSPLQEARDFRGPGKTPDHCVNKIK